MNAELKQRLNADINLRLERVDNSHSVQVVNVRTSGANAILVNSSGSLPKPSIRDLRFLKFAAVAFSQHTKKDIIVRHNTTTISTIRAEAMKSPVVSIRWWNLAKLYFLGMRKA